MIHSTFRSSTIAVAVLATCLATARVASAAATEYLCNWGNGWVDVQGSQYLYGYYWQREISYGMVTSNLQLWRRVGQNISLAGTAQPRDGKGRLWTAGGKAALFYNNGGTFYLFYPVGTSCSRFQLLSQAETEFFGLAYWISSGGNTPQVVSCVKDCLERSGFALSGMCVNHCY